MSIARACSAPQNGAAELSSKHLQCLEESMCMSLSAAAMIFVAFPSCDLLASADEVYLLYVGRCHYNLLVGGSFAELQDVNTAGSLEGCSSDAKASANILLDSVEAGQSSAASEDIGKESLERAARKRQPGSADNKDTEEAFDMMTHFFHSS